MGRVGAARVWEGVWGCGGWLRGGWVGRLLRPMSILVDQNTRVIGLDITGSAGVFHTKGCHDYGTKMVGVVTPRKCGTKDAYGLPAFNTCAEEVKETGADSTMIFVPPAS